MYKLTKNFVLIQAIFLAVFKLGCDDNKNTEEADTSDIETEQVIVESCDMGCMEGNTCQKMGGKIAYRVDCPIAGEVCCNANVTDDSLTQANDTAPIDCAFSCVQFSACEMRNMHHEMRCNSGICCDTRDNNPDAQADATLCQYNCVPYAYCERQQIHPEQVCNVTGQICCDGDAVFIPDSDTLPDSDTVMNIDSDSSIDDTATMTDFAEDTSTATSETDNSSEVLDTGSDTFSDDVTSTDSATESDVGTDTLDTATESDTDTLVDCAFFCVAADQCIVINYHSEMYCAVAGTVCCDIQ